MSTFLSLIFWLAVVAGAVAFLVQLAGWSLRAHPEPDGLEFVETEDGWRLTLTHYRPTDPLPGAPPVILCPGGGMTSTIFDLDRDSSLARFLRDHGHDVWLLDLRGRGPGFATARRERQRPNWSFDDYVEFDLPVAIHTVLERTGARQVQWVGFGVGALVVYAAMGRGLTGHIASLTSLGAAAHFRRQRASFNPRTLRWLRLAPLRPLLRLLSPLLGRLWPVPLRQLQNRDNVDGPLYRRALVNGYCGLSRTEALQYAEWLEHDAFTAIVQRSDFREAMAEGDIPTLLVSGPRDELAPPEAVEATAELLEGAPERTVVVASRMHGTSANYGHLDLLLGRSARRDVFTHVLRWLDLHAGLDELPADRPGPPEPRERTSFRGSAPRAGRKAPPRREPDPVDEEDEDDDVELDDEDELSEEELMSGDVPHVPPRS